MLLREVARCQQLACGDSPAGRHLASALAHVSRAVETAQPSEAYIISTAQALLNVLSAVGAPSLAVVPQTMVRTPPGRSHVFEVAYINLRTRPDRRKSVEEQLVLAGLQAARLEASTGADTPDACVARSWDSHVNAQFDSKTVGHPRVAMSPGERGCAMSHRVLWEIIAGRPDTAPRTLPLRGCRHGRSSCRQLRAQPSCCPASALVPRCVGPHDLLAPIPVGGVACSADTHLFFPPRNPPSFLVVRLLLAAVLILEDDAVLCADFTRKLLRLLHAVEASFTHSSERRVLLYLCADVAAWRGAPYELEPGLGMREAAYLWQTAAYVIWSPAARALIPLASPIDCPVDVFLAKCTLDGHISSFVASPQLAQQAVPFQNGDVLHSNFYQAHVLVNDNLRRRLDANQASLDAADNITGTDGRAPVPATRSAAPMPPCLAGAQPQAAAEASPAGARAAETGIGSDREPAALTSTGMQDFGDLVGGVVVSEGAGSSPVLGQAGASIPGLVGKVRAGSAEDPSLLLPLRPAGRGARASPRPRAAPKQEGRDSRASGTGAG